MNFRLLAAFLAACVAAAGFVGPGFADELPGTQPAMLRSGDSLPVVDRVVVHKAQRRLDLMQGGNVVRSYHIALGLSPTGQKERSGDFRTPEGDYRLDR